MAVSLILATATRLVLPLLLLFSAFILIRGHDDPGGGFAGGLVAAIGFTLIVISEDVATARRALRVSTRSLIGVGLLLAMASGIAGMVLADAFLQAVFFDLPLLAGGRIELSTVFFFDVGVYLTVIGVTLTIVFTLAEAVAEERDVEVRRGNADEMQEGT